ncbi:class I SAM-dependent methyltransferase [Kibdelosporangium aridum]|uniref:Class I SAM-dependent methyltransferase n=1 Tax=Kibdelosporangium aridum TaxID=2030 RepID=A0A428Z6N0_KIBAR|nr:class I SAM-dependent methyltransferase [Kibdelosporangium aridum]RSM82863.1 class I SAM-dependent methyltransferase [Kibdelosporangium aridum]
MPMNLIHRKLCRSDTWVTNVRETLMPWTLEGVDLGDDVLEIGPGFGATTRVLIDKVPNLTAVEVDPASVRLLTEQFPSVNVIEGDGAELPLPDNSFSAVTCFTMLHHVPSPAEQDRLFAETFRVLKPQGLFVGLDSRPNLRFRFIHLFDTMIVVDPDTLPRRLETVGFRDIDITKTETRFRFRARKP